MEMTELLHAFSTIQWIVIGYIIYIGQNEINRMKIELEKVKAEHTSINKLIKSMDKKIDILINKK